MNAQVIPMNDHAAISIQLSPREQFAQDINATHRRVKDDLILIGKMLLTAKRELPHGEFTAMIYLDMDFSPWTARQYMRIASNSVLVERWNSNVLPKTKDALDILRKLPEGKLEQAIDQGRVTAESTIDDCRNLMPRTRTPHHVEARPADELRDPITDADELLATLIGYRKRDGVSQRDADEQAGLQEGYTSKLEVDIRRAVHESLWLWIGARKLAMLLIPIKGSTANRTKCPCCERAL